MSAAKHTLLALALIVIGAGSVGAADLVALSPSTWDRYAPAGKEVDAIHGDFVLANDAILAVVANPIRGRHANMGIRDVSGAIIDLTRRDAQSDQLGAYWPGGPRAALRFAGVDARAPRVYETADPKSLFIQAKSVTLKCMAEPKPGEPDVTVAYTLADGSPYVLVESTFHNGSTAPTSIDLIDVLRAERSFEKSPDGTSSLFWVHDKWFGQAYGVQGEGLEILSGSSAISSNLRLVVDGKSRLTLQPGESRTITRRLIPGANTLDVRAAAESLTAKSVRTDTIEVVDASGAGIAGADVQLNVEGKPYAAGRTDASGQLHFTIIANRIDGSVRSAAHGSKTFTLGASGKPTVVTLESAGVVAAEITDETGGKIPCKVQFRGVDGTPTPDFGPDSGEFRVKNLVYSASGSFKQPLAPGKYDVIVSYGPEYDAVFTQVDVERGKTADLKARLVRSVKTPGWISTDYHSHSSPSGDNSSSQLGRVLNLLCEQVEFAPCTEHNRVSTYIPHLERLGVIGRMATCCGIELTGKPLPINHQNAFPIVMRPGVQDNGGPTPDDDPEVQIARLALWDQGADKLVQVNHPDIGWMFYDRDGNQQPDKGYHGMHGQMDVIEIHPPHLIFESAVVKAQNQVHNNTIFNWLQLLNQGKRIPGVVNTDAHYNFHGSGWLRNYVKSPTDDPAKVETLDVVHASEKGHLIMTNGPYLEVSVKAGETVAIAGDDLKAPGGSASLHVRVQCPNWFDVDRVQVFLNGRPEPTLNFTRSEHSEKFSDATVKFESTLPLTLQGDTHVIVATIGERSKLGEVMGPDHRAEKPVAVSNPIFVDVDGQGFKPNGDTLGAPLPVKASSGGH